MSREKLSEIFLADQNSMAPLILSEDTIRIKRQEKRKLGGRGLTKGPFPISSSKNFHFNRLSPNGDQHQISPNNILILSREMVARINQKITKEKML